MIVNTRIRNLKTTLVASAVASVLAACASAPVRPTGAMEARARLTQLQSDPELANRAPLAVQAADAAVRVAEQPASDEELVAYRVYIANRKVDMAKVEAETKLAEDQRSDLSAKREKARLDARTHELQIARMQTASALAQGAEQKSLADAARSDANAANLAAADSNQQAVQARIETSSADLAAVNSNQQAIDARSDANAANLAAASSNQQAVDARSDASRAELAAANSNQQAIDARNEANNADFAAAAAKQQSAELQQRIDALQATVTDRGLVVTLGDVLFASGGAGLKQHSSGNLDRLVAFLDQYPDRTATIEGYTDNRGSDESNQTLSQRRADAVKSYLVEQGVRSNRLRASGEGESSPVADNDSAAGRQQNRRVEVIITNP